MVFEAMPLSCHNWPEVSGHFGMCGMLIRVAEAIIGILLQTISRADFSALLSEITSTASAGISCSLQKLTGVLYARFKQDFVGAGMIS